MNVTAYFGIGVSEERIKRPGEEKGGGRRLVASRCCIELLINFSSPITGLNKVQQWRISVETDIQALFILEQSPQLPVLLLTLSDWMHTVLPIHFCCFVPDFLIHKLQRPFYLRAYTQPSGFPIHVSSSLLPSFHTAQDLRQKYTRFSPLAQYINTSLPLPSVGRVSPLVQRHFAGAFQHDFLRRGRIHCVFTALARSLDLLVFWERRDRKCRRENSVTCHL